MTTLSLLIGIFIVNEVNSESFETCSIKPKNIVLIIADDLGLIY